MSASQPRRGERDMCVCVHACFFFKTKNLNSTFETKQSTFMRERKEKWAVNKSVARIYILNQVRGPLPRTLPHLLDVLLATDSPNNLETEVVELIQKLTTPASLRGYHFTF